MTDPLLFALAVLALLATPGPTNTLLAVAGASGGLRRGLRLLPAEASGYLVAVLLVATLLGPLVAAVPGLVPALRAGVGVYLVWLAVRLWRGGAIAAGAQAVRPLDVFTTTLVNPKAVVFALGVIPFGAPGVAAYLAAFVAMILMAGFSWLTVGAGLGRAARAGGAARLVPRCGSAVLGLVGGAVLTSVLVG